MKAFKQSKESGIVFQAPAGITRDKRPYFQTRQLTHCSLWGSLHTLLQLIELLLQIFVFRSNGNAPLLWMDPYADFSFLGHRDDYDDLVVMGKSGVLTTRSEFQLAKSILALSAHIDVQSDS